MSLKCGEGRSVAEFFKEFDNDGILQSNNYSFGNFRKRKSHSQKPTSRRGTKEANFDFGNLDTSLINMFFVSQID